MNDFVPPAEVPFTGGSPPAAGRTASANAFSGLGLLFLAGVYLFAAQLQSSHVNHSRHMHDQSAVLNFAKRISQYGSSYVAPRNRMPLYPWLQSLVYKRGESDERFFAAAKSANIYLSLALLAVVFTLFRSYFPLHHSLNTLLIAAFGVFVLKAPYVQPELLYYVFTFGCFLLMLRILARPSLPSCLALGVALALTHLTKASTLPAVALFSVCYAARLAFPPLAGDVPVGSPPRRWQKELLCGALVIITFLAVISPYLLNSKKIYGRYFYNVNSTFYMWCDSWEEAKRFSEMYDDRHVFPHLPDEQMPSAHNYLRSHSGGQIAQRFLKGSGRMLTEVFRSFWYSPFLLIYAGAAGYAWWRAPGSFSAAVRRRPIIPIFILLYFSCYGALYAWWMILARSQRFVLALFLPALFVLSLAFQSATAGAGPRTCGRELSLGRFVDYAVSALCAVNIVALLLWTARSVNGASTM